MPSLTALSLQLLAAISTVTASPVPGVSGENRSCAPVHIFVARGTSEPPGAGSIGSLADLVVQSYPEATVEAIDYPAAADPYIQSVNQGIDAVTDQLSNYTNKCHNSQVVLMGYSQGIHIILDALCGSGNPAWGGTGWASVSDETGSHGVYSQLDMKYLLTSTSQSDSWIRRSSTYHQPSIQPRHWYQKWGQ